MNMALRPTRSSTDSLVVRSFPRCVGPSGTSAGVWPAWTLRHRVDGRGRGAPWARRRLGDVSRHGGLRATVLETVALRCTTADGGGRCFTTFGIKQGVSEHLHLVAPNTLKLDAPWASGPVWLHMLHHATPSHCWTKPYRVLLERVATLADIGSLRKGL